MRKENVQCPRCKGAGGDEILISHYWEKTNHVWDECRLCEGDKEINQMKLAIYKARGGLPPVPMQGFA